MDYIILSALGGAIFLITSILDYYWSKRGSSESYASNSNLEPSDILVGSKPERKKQSFLTIEPRYVGYLLAIALQLPALVSQLGWL